MFDKQAEFLCYEGREALYGGAAGGGKSVALLVAALQYVEQAGYAALILRRTFKQLAKADSILAKSKEWLWGKAKWHGDEHKWTFPSGATLEFGHMETEDAKHNYQGGAWHYIGVDEVTQFKDTMIAYPMTRQRRAADSALPIRWRGASNPGGVGHEYVKHRFVKGPDGVPVTYPSRRFFPATIDDNPNIDRAEYVAQLRESGVDPLTLEQLLKGNWDAVPGGRFQRDWFGFYRRQGDYLVFERPGVSQRLCKLADMTRFQTVDCGASDKPTADWTVCSTWGDTPWHDLCWLGCARRQLRVPDIIPFLQHEWLRWRPDVMGIEAVFGNRAVADLARVAGRPALNVRDIQPRVGGRMADKAQHAAPAINFAASGRVWLPSDDPTFPVQDVLAELVRFTGTDQDDHDDIVDTLSAAVQLHTSMPTPDQKRAKPSVIGGPSLTNGGPFGGYHGL